VDGVVDRRRRPRAIDADERGREPGVEEGGGERRVEQARLAGADPGAIAGRAAGEGALPEGGADQVVLQHPRRPRPVARFDRVHLAWLAGVGHLQFAEAALRPVRGKHRQRRRLHLAALLQAGGDEGGAAALALDRDR